MLVSNFSSKKAFNYAKEHNFQMLINELNLGDNLLKIVISKSSKNKDKWTLSDVKKACSKAFIHHIFDSNIKFTNKNTKSYFLDSILESVNLPNTNDIKLVIDDKVKPISNAIINTFSKYIDIVKQMNPMGMIHKITKSEILHLKQTSDWRNIQTPLQLQPTITPTTPITTPKKNKKKKIPDAPKKNKKKKTKSKTSKKNKNIIELDKDDVCCICLEKIDLKSVKKRGILISKCNHKFCSTCIFNNIGHGNNDCPMCRSSFVENKKIKELEDKLELFKTNIDNVLHILKNVMKKNNYNPSYTVSANNSTKVKQNKDLDSKVLKKFLPAFYTKLYTAHIHPLERDDPQNW